MPSPTPAMLVAETYASADDARTLSTLVRRLEATGCTGIATKVAEYKGSGPRAEDLIAELRLALALSEATRSSVELQGGAAHDLRLLAPGVDCTIEVEHKSSVSAFGAVFYPDAASLAGYARSNAGWRAAAVRLHEVVEQLPFEVHPWVGKALSEPCWAGSDRAKQEEACGQLAAWLAAKLADVPPGGSVQLHHEHARFDVKPLAGRPGRICGAGPIDAFILREHPDGTGGSLSEWLVAAVRRKSKIAAANPVRRGAIHLVGLVIDEAYACDGRMLASAFLGGLVADFGASAHVQRHYRPVPIAGRPLVDEARKRGQSALLDRMQFDRETPTKEGIKWAGAGVVFDAAIRDHADGIVALYYTGTIQLLPNPVTERNIEPLCALFPKLLEPFDPRPP